MHTWNFDHVMECSQQLYPRPNIIRHCIQHCNYSRKNITKTSRVTMVNTVRSLWTTIFKILTMDITPLQAIYRRTWSCPFYHRPVALKPVSHNASFCNRNVNMCPYFSYKMVHCGILDTLWDLWYIFIAGCYARSRYRGQGQLITPHSICGMYLLVPVLDAGFWHNSPPLDCAV